MRWTNEVTTELLDTFLLPLQIEIDIGSRLAYARRALIRSQNEHVSIPALRLHLKRLGQRDRRVQYFRPALKSFHRPQITSGHAFLLVAATSLKGIENGAREYGWLRGLFGLSMDELIQTLQTFQSDGLLSHTVGHPDWWASVRAKALRTLKG